MSVKRQVMDIPAATVVVPRAAAMTPELLLVCLQDPFAAVGDSSNCVEAGVADGTKARQWKLEAVMEMNPPRFFEGWATRGSFTLDLSVSASVSPASGTWGGTAATGSGVGNCRVMVMRDGDDKVRFSLASHACHAPETAMPTPDGKRFLNADIAFDGNGPGGLSAAAVATISSMNWSQLIAGSATTIKGMAFDGKWRQNLTDADGDAAATGAWAFMVMTADAYETLCTNHGWVPRIQD